MGEDEPRASKKVEDKDRSKVNKVNPIVATKSSEKYNRSFGLITNYKLPTTSMETSLSPEDLEKLKKIKPSEYLKMMISPHGSSGDKCSSASTTSGGVSTISSVKATMCAIKTKVFGMDLFNTLAQDAFSAFKIKYLLKKVDIPKAFPLVANFVMETGFLVDHQ